MIDAQKIFAKEWMSLGRVLGLEFGQGILKLSDPLAHFGYPAMQVLGGREDEPGRGRLEIRMLVIINVTLCIPGSLTSRQAACRHHIRKRHIRMTK